jgi:hypothetical protein
VVKLTQKELRQIINETLYANVEKRAKQVLLDAIRDASTYVIKLERGEQDKKLASKMKESSEVAASLARWLIGKKHPFASRFARAAQLLVRISDESSFWKKPLVLGKDSHVKKVRLLLDLAKDVSSGILDVDR